MDANRVQAKLDFFPTKMVKNLHRVLLYVSSMHALYHQPELPAGQTRIRERYIF
jgi:hypothetical protein